MQSRKKYLAYNIVIWCAISLIGLSLLTIVRHYGMDYRARHEAMALIYEAEDAHNGGRINEVQNKLLLAMRKSPNIIVEIINLFGMNLLGMPNVTVGIQNQFQTLDTKKTNVDSLNMAYLQFLLVNGNYQKGEKLLYNNLQQKTGFPEAKLWAARLSMQRGDFDAASGLYDTYWKSTSEKRYRIAEKLLVNAEADNYLDMTKLALLFMEMGLLNEAFEMAEKARMSGDISPELLFLQGMYDDLAGNRDSAITHYTNVLSKRPGHLLSLRRLETLLSPQPEVF